MSELVTLEQVRSALNGEHAADCECPVCPLVQDYHDTMRRLFTYVMSEVRKDDNDGVEEVADRIEIIFQQLTSRRGDPLWEN